MWNDKQKTKNQIRIGEMHGDIVQGSTIVDNSVHYTVLQDPADVICELKGDPAALQKFMKNMNGSLEKSHALYPYYGVGIQEYEGENYLYSKALIPEAKERYPESVKGQFTITVPEGISLDDYKRQSYISQTPIPIDKAVITKMLGDDPDPFQEGFQKEMSEAHFEIVPEPLPKPIECELGVSGWNDTYQLSYQIQPTDPGCTYFTSYTKNSSLLCQGEILFQTRSPHVSVLLQDVKYVQPDLSAVSDMITDMYHSIRKRQVHIQLASVKAPEQSQNELRSFLSENLLEKDPDHPLTSL